VCATHGAQYKRCSHEGCTSKAKKGGVCFRHGAKTPCVHEGCKNKVQLGGLCKKHYRLAFPSTADVDNNNGQQQQPPRKRRKENQNNHQQTSQMLNGMDSEETDPNNNIWGGDDRVDFNNGDSLEIQDEREQLSSLTSERDILLSRVEECSVQNARLETEKADAVAKSSWLEDAMVRLQSQVSDLTEVCGSSKSEIVHLRSKIETDNIKFRSLESELAKSSRLEDVIVRLQSQVSDLTEACGSSKSEIINLRSKIESDDIKFRASESEPKSSRLEDAIVRLQSQNIEMIKVAANRQKFEH